MSADLSGNGHRLNTVAPQYPRGHFWGGWGGGGGGGWVGWGGGWGGGLGGHKFKSLGKLSNGCTDWHHIWYTSADSSGNGPGLCSNAFANAAFLFALAFDCPVMDAFALAFAFDSSAFAFALAFDSTFY